MFIKISNLITMDLLFIIISFILLIYIVFSISLLHSYSLSIILSFGLLNLYYPLFYSDNLNQTLIISSNSKSFSQNLKHNSILLMAPYFYIDSKNMLS
jgi:hypothetical protein